MNRLLTQRLAAQSHTRQVEASVRADAAADAVDRVFAEHWRSLLRSLHTRSIHQAQTAAHQHLAAALPLAVQTVHRLLSDVTQWSFRTSRRHAETTLPLAYLQAGTERRLGLVESLLEAPAILAPAVSDVGGPQPAHGSVELAMHGLGVPLEPAKFGLTLTPMVEPAMKPLADAAKRVAFLDLLFPPPSQSLVDSIIYATIKGKTWVERLATMTKTSATPQQLATVVGHGIAQGKTVQEIAKQLLPVVDGVRSTARRIARTEALRVVQEASFRSWQGMGDLVIGYQIHAVLDQVTRPEHAKRNGTIYYKEPRSGQKGLDEMPHPPLEADGSYAFNCMLPGTIVEGTFQVGSKASYAGKAIEITTRHGNRLRVTPNHPVLTPAGFVAAGTIKKGDHLLRYVRNVRASSHHEENRPASIQDVYRAFSELPGVVSSRPKVLDFHGDEVAVKGEVEVVFAESELAVEHETGILQGFSDSRFGRGGVRAFREPRSGPGFLDGVGILTAPSSYLGSGYLSPACSDVHASPLHKLRFGSAANLNASLYEDASQAAQLSPSASRYAELPGKLLHGLAGFVAMDDVVQVRNFDFAGHVYDLESPYGWIVADNLVVHNCRCGLSQCLAPPSWLRGEQLTQFETAAGKAIGDPHTYDQWFSVANEQHRKEAVGARRYNLVADVTGGKPEWAAFVSPEDGGLLSLDTLRSETVTERATRIHAVRLLMAERRNLLGRVLRGQPV